MTITLEKVTKRFGSVGAVEDLSLEIESGEFVALLGPSGCGKTTTLLMLAGVYKPTSGHIRFDDEVVNDLLPGERNVGMVFQSYALYSHMTVFRNIAYPLRLKRLPRAEIEARVHRVARLLEIDHLLDRKPAQLSGGQQQRVALGRALVKEPDLLLFDEPLSNLDARLRLTMRSELRRLQRDLGITSLYVTHDQVEAMSMADRIAVLREGKLEAYGPPAELYDRPATRFVAGFLGNPPMNLIEGLLQRAEPAADARGGFCFVRPGLELQISPEAGRKALGASAAREVVFGIRPEHLRVSGTQAADNQPGWEAQIVAVEPLGREDLLDCRAGDATFYVLAPPGGTDGAPWRPGQRVRLVADRERVSFFDPETGRAL